MVHQIAAAAASSSVRGLLLRLENQDCDFHLLDTPCFLPNTEPADFDQRRQFIKNDVAVGDVHSNGQGVVDRWFKEEGTRNFLRFARIRDDFIINYFQNKLNLIDINNIFNQLDSLNLPISIDNCLIIKEVLDLKDNEEFIESFFNNLKKNTREFRITINKIPFKVCINEEMYQTIEKIIVEYIQIKTADEFETFVYEKTKN